MARINGERLLADLRELASIGAYQTGVDRVALSPQDIAARRWLVDKLRRAGLDASMDRVGNVLGRAPTAKAILIGSHTDTVPKGGWLDGALGVGYALEIARSMIESGERTAGVDVISFEDEEGTYLSVPRQPHAFSDIDEKEIAAARSKDGGARLRRCKRSPASLSLIVSTASASSATSKPISSRGRAWKRPAIASASCRHWSGIRRYRIRSHGAANHAGTTPMSMRRDAGAALIELGAKLNGEFQRLADRDTVWNFGNMVFRPGAANVVPGEGEMLLEFRDISADVLDRFEAALQRLVAEANRGPAAVEVETTARIPPTALTEDLGEAIAAAARAHGEEPVRLPSGAGHDVMVVARHMPAAMLFVPSIGGISHDVRENTSDADIVFGCEVLADAVARICAQA